MMDFDEDEVTREPFYDESDERDGELVDLSKDEEFVRVGRCRTKLEATDGDEPTPESNSGSIDGQSISSVCSEDIELAKSYNIYLKEAKRKTAALYQSKFINPEQSSEKRLISTSVTSDCIHHKGVFLQKGDIVGMCDQDDGQMYFAQLTGFVQDIYCEKSASVNWLVPIRPTSREVFDPADYKIGQEDTQLRKLDSMVFIRHSPSDYYLNDRCRQTTGLDSASLNSDLRHYQKRCQPYIWTTMAPCTAPRIKPGKSQPSVDNSEK